MNNKIDMMENNFLIPYYKQFMKLLQNDKILLLENMNTNALEYFTSQGKNVTKKTEESELGGAIFNNYLSKMSDRELVDFINDIHARLIDKGVVLVINNIKELDKETLNYLFKNKFEEVEELIGDNKWNFILYEKRTTK